MTSWTFNGVDLSTFGVITILDDYLDMPARRGEDQKIAHYPGSLFVPKYYDERDISMGISIRKGSAIELESALDNLRRLVSIRSQKILSNIRADGSVRTVLASVDRDLQVKRESYIYAKIVLVFHLSFPFFRSNTLYSQETVVDTNPEDFVWSNPGTVEEINPKISMYGPLDTVVLTNLTNGHVLSYNAAIASPRVVTFEVVNGEFQVKDDLGANLVSNMTRSGGYTLMCLETGDNSMRVASVSPTTGKVKVEFYPPFL